MLYAALHFVLDASQHMSQHATTSSSNKAEITPNRGSATKGLQNTDRHADRGGYGGARSPARPPLVSCVLPSGSGGAGWSSLSTFQVGRLSTVAARLPATLAPLDRREEPVPCKRPRRCPECGSWRSRPPRRRSHSLGPPPLASLDSTAIIIMPRRRCRIEIHASAPPFAGCHFEITRWGSRGAAAPHTATEISPSHPKSWTKMRFLAVATAARRCHSAGL